LRSNARQSLVAASPGFQFRRQNASPDDAIS
jgi:hypothetical protein